MKDITVGQYIPGDNLLYLLDPRVKIGITLLFTLALLSTKGLLSYAVVSCWLAGALFSSGLRLGFIFRGLKGFLGLICMTALFSAVFTPGIPYIQWGWISVSREGLGLAGEFVVRFMLLIAGTSLLTYTTSPLSLLYGLGFLLRPFRRLGVPAHELAMMMSIALRFVPIMTEEAGKIMNAQRARGADFTGGNLLQQGRAFLPLIVPLFLSAWRRAEELSIAMDARCYHGGEGRTEWRKFRLTGMDIGVLTGAMVLTGLVLGARLV